MIRRHPKGPRRRRWQELRERRSQGVYLLPSLLTTANLAAGFLALLLTAHGRYVDAAFAIYFAMVMDLLDGRVARLMKAQSQFGVEFDSLADVVSFCVAPAFLVYSFALSQLGKPAWFGAFLFLICGALRLARFNVQTGTTDRRFFVGLATPPAAGVIAATAVLLAREELTRWILVAIAVGTYVVALLMVSTFRYWSFKEIDVARRHPVQALLVVVLGGMIIATNHEWVPFLIFAGYALSGPIGRPIVGRSPAPAPDVAAKES